MTLNFWTVISKNSTEWQNIRQASNKPLKYVILALYSVKDTSAVEQAHDALTIILPIQVC